MRSRVLRATLGLVATFALLAAACGGGGGEKKANVVSNGKFKGVSITFSDSVAESEQAAVKEVLGMFQDQTGAKVTLTQVDAQSLPQKLKVEVSSNHHTIQLFAQDNLALAPLVADNLVQDVSDVAIPSEVQQALIPEKFDGKQYFLPYRPNVRVT